MPTDYEKYLSAKDTGSDYDKYLAVKNQKLDLTVDFKPQPADITRVDPSYFKPDIPKQEGFLPLGTTEKIMGAISGPRLSLAEGLPGERMFEDDVPEKVRRVAANLIIGAQEFIPGMALSVLEDPIGAAWGIVKFYPELSMKLTKAFGEFPPDYRKVDGKWISESKKISDAERTQARQELMEDPFSVVLASLPAFKNFKGAKAPKAKVVSEPIQRGRVKLEPEKTTTSELRHAGLTPEVFKKEKLPLRKNAEEKFLSAVRERKVRVFKAHEKARRWEKEYSEGVREDAGALVEGIENLRTGKTPKATPEILKLKKEYQHAQEASRKDVNEYLRNTGEQEYISFLDDYLPHFYTGNIKKSTGKWLTQSPNAKARKLPTLKEAVQLGLKPLSQDVAFLHKTWADINWKVAANRQIIYDFKKLKTSEGKPAFVAGEQPGPEWKRFDHPAIAKVYAKRGKDGTLHLWRGGVWAHPDVVPVARMAFENPLADRSWIGRTYDVINAYAKSGELAFSGFHFIALAESGQAVLAKAKNPFRGLFLSEKEGKGLTFRTGKKIQRERPDIIEDAIRHGLEIGSANADIGYQIVSRNLRSLEAKAMQGPFGKYVHQIPKKLRQGYEAVNKGLWEQVHEGYKTYSYYTIVADELARLPKNIKSTEISKVKKTVAKVLNDAFGGQEWESKFWLSPNNLHMARRAFLAPDWTLSNLSIFGRPIFEAKNPIVRRLGARYWRNMAASIFGATQALNYWSTGHFTWDNEPGHKLDIDITKIRQLVDEKLGREPSKQRYYVRIAKQAREVLSYYQDPLKIAGNKMSPMARQVFTQVTGHQPGSGFPADWTREELDFYESIPKRFITFANTFTPFSLSGNNFAFSLPMSKGMTPYKAIRYYQRALDAREHTVFGKKVTKWKTIEEIHQAVVDNGHNPKELFSAAMSSVRTKYYNAFYEALEKQDYEKINEIAKRLGELNVKSENIKQAMQRRMGQ